MNYDRTIEDVVETLRNAKRRGKKCTLLIGAGCSVTAGIPLAGEIVQVIKKRFPRDFAQAKQKAGGGEPGYPLCMAELADAERRDLIAEYVKTAKINWAHVAVAQLMKAGMVDRVFTTNFDPLVLKACALVGEYPAVYDFTTSQQFKPAYLPDKAVFHLHGQHTGFVLLHTPDQFKTIADAIAPLFDAATQGRVWLVVGYSGDNDPVFKQLAQVACFDERLYWVGYGDSEPASHVAAQVLGEKKSAYFVKGHDADGFFTNLARKLDCFPPDFVQKPFSHLSNVLAKITPYSPPDTPGGLDLCATAHGLIQKAIEELEQGSASKALKADALLAAGQYEAVIQMQSDAQSSPELTNAVAWAYVMLGNREGDQAKTKSGQEADDLFGQACQKYAEAVRIKPDMHEAWNNWGNAVLGQAKTKSGQEADELFGQACQKYAEAVKIKPDKHEAWCNWGIALASQAKTKSGQEADDLFAQSYQKYTEAVKIKPDMHEAWSNWGSALDDQAKPKSGQEADELFAQAYQKYAEAVRLKPSMHEAWSNWGVALSGQAKTKSGKDADDLFAQAYQKYAEAVRLKPSMHEAWCNWGSELLGRAKTKSGQQADDLFGQACQKLQKAESLLPGSGAYNMACVCAMRGDGEGCRKWLQTSRDNGRLPTKEHVLSDLDLASMRGEKWFQDFVAESWPE